MFEIKYRHYIRINSQSEIIHAFSNAFEQPIETDILLQETEERHCQFQVFSEKHIGKYKYKYIDEQIVEKTEEELYTVEDRKADKIREIKAEAGRRILEKYPLWKQINLIGKFDKDKDTDEKRKDMEDFINLVRTWSNEEENNI